MKLYPYQQTDVQRLLKALYSPAVRKPRILYQLPTGGGKSVVGRVIADNYLRQEIPITWLTHRIELKDQVEKHLKQTKHRNYLIKSPLQLRNMKNRGETLNDTGLLIVDEAHHTSARTWDEVVKQWQGPVLGMTATPWRLSAHEGLNKQYKQMISGPTLQQLTTGKYLSKIKYFAATGEQINPHGGLDNTGDFNQRKTEKHYGDVKLRAITRSIIKQAIQKANGLPILVFAMTQGHAKTAKTIFGENHVKVGVVTSKTKKSDRENIINQFQDKEIQALVNVNILTEGYDYPDIYLCVMLRPTQSLVMYLQMIGRITRLSQLSDHCMVLDGARNYTRFCNVHDSNLEVPYCADGHWSLQARGVTNPGENTPSYKACPDCGAICLNLVRTCFVCNYKFGLECNICGTWRNKEFYMHGNLHCVDCEHNINARIEEIKLKDFKKKENDTVKLLLKDGYRSTRNNLGYYKRVNGRTIVIGRRNTKKLFKYGMKIFYCSMYKTGSRYKNTRWGLGSLEEAYIFAEINHNSNGDNASIKPTRLFTH